MQYDKTLPSMLLYRCLKRQLSALSSATRWTSTGSLHLHHLQQQQQQQQHLPAAAAGQQHLMQQAAQQQAAADLAGGAGFAWVVAHAQHQRMSFTRTARYIVASNCILNEDGK